MAAGRSSLTSVKLVFGETSLQVLLEANAGLEALVAAVEERFGLHPDSFSIRDGFGKVDGPMALQRLLDSESPCVLEVREAPEWQKIREMETKINMLVARCPVVDSVLLSIEERSAKRFEKLSAALQGVEERAAVRSSLAVAELRQDFQELDAKVNNSIAPLLKCVALQEMELNTKLDSMSTLLLAQETDSKINSGIAPMLQSMALQQMDLKDKVDSLQQVEVVAKDLQKELDMSNASVQALQVEVRDLAEQPAMGGDAWAKSLMLEVLGDACRQDLGKSPKHTRNSLGGDREVHGEWTEGSAFAADLSSGFAYSKKSNIGMMPNSFNIGGAGAVPFARFIAPRSLDRLQGSRSLPHLPPMAR